MKSQAFSPVQMIMMAKGVSKLNAVIFLFSAIAIEGLFAEENTTDRNLTLYISALFNSTVNPGISSNLTSNVAFSHCNRYCNGTSQEQIISGTCLSAIPRCKPCQCDDMCHKLGDCCPDSDGMLPVVRETKYECVASKGSSHDSVGYLMVTACRNESSVNPSLFSNDDIHPVTSQNTNITFINARVADCNDDVQYRFWNKETICNEISDNSTLSGRCKINLNADHDVFVYMCDPIFSSNKFIDTCNITGLWNGLNLNSDFDLKVECGRFPPYPVADKQFVFKNIYCFLCNGLQRSETKCFEVASMESINVLVSMVAERSPGCSRLEWHDKLKNICRRLQCRSGFHLKGGNCEMKDVNLTAIRFLFRGYFWPLNPEQPSPGSWSEVKSLVVQNLPHIMTQINAPDYVFDVYSLVSLNSTTYLTPAFGLDLEFRTNNSCCRLMYEDSLTDAFSNTWTLNDTHSTYEYIMKRADTLNFVVNESEKFKVVFPNVVPVKNELHFYLSQIVENLEVAVTLPITTPDCSFVYLKNDDFIWKSDGTIKLQYADIVISPDNFSETYDQELVICKSTLEHLYSNYQPPADPFRHAENIVSLICSVLSLVCLTLTFITYCTFTSLLTLPTKNTMCLVVSLFIAQLLLQFGDVSKQNDVPCETMGVLIHYFWLCVIFWMNVCSFHMFRVFVIDAGKAISLRGHNKRLFRYFIYANGTPAIIVLVTITANLGVSSGSQIGYGDGPCYLSTALLTGVAFVLPLCIVLILNAIFFGISVKTMAKINKMSDAVGKQRNHVHIYIKLSTLTGLFWIFSILAENLRVEVLIFISTILNASQGVFIFISYVANKRVLKMWSGKFGIHVSSQTSTNTASTQL